ncbi:hypothetical protein [Haloarchaeobius salinus]|uniref:hypothetical protein n=1 Tax=Haloarchaeobius salinus TaxID=1198298 RepID=UPI00210DB47A|nr:hypothetical protein [Haloarchaeobius salinus]
MEEITAFDFGNTYLFTAYFDEEQLFNQLEKYYNRDKYRFKVPEEDLEEVQQTLDSYFYELVIEDSPEEYCVVADEETDSNAILSNSVMRKQRRNHDIYLMKDKLSLEQAVEKGAIRVEKSEVNTGNLEWKTNGS